MSTEDILKNIFKEKALELLAEIENSLLELEQRPYDILLIWRIIRAFHTLKGSGAALGYDNITKFIHEIETVYDMASEKKLTINKDVINLTFAAHDHILNMLDFSEKTDFSDDAVRGPIVASLQNIIMNNPTN